MKRIFLFLLTLAAAASCSKEPAPTPGGADAAIRVVAGVAATRAVADASTGLRGASFIVVEGGATAPSFAGGTAYTGDVAATTGVVTFTSNPVPAYNRNGQNAWFAAYAPGKARTDNAVEWTIDGKTDIMVTNAVWNAGKHSAPVSRGLNFNHRLAQVEVICRAESGAAISAVRAAWGNITKIEFVGAPTTMKYDLSAAPAVTVSGSADFALLADYDGTAFAPTAIPENANTAANAVAMLAPVTPTISESFTLKVTTAGASGISGAASAPITLEIPVSLAGSPSPMTAGRKHEVTLTFKADSRKIAVTATAITPWGTGYSGGSDVEFPKPAVNDYYYSDGTFSTALDTGKSVEGVIFWTDPDDPKHFKIVALTEETKQWSTSRFDVGTGAYSALRSDLKNPTIDDTARQNGKANRKLLGQWIANTGVNTTDQKIENFPAFHHCDLMGGVTAGTCLRSTS